MTITEKLLDSVKEIWAGYHTHPFVKGIGDGSLDQKKFRHYMIQDYLYLIDYTKVFAVGVAKAKDLSVMKLFAASTHNILDGEMDIHRTYMERLGISLEEAETTPVSLDNRFLYFLYAAGCLRGRRGKVMAAILSCALSYEAIAKQIVRKIQKQTNIHSTVSGYPVMPVRVTTKKTERLIGMMNRLAADCTPAQEAHLIDIFTACSRYEAAFWDMAWEMRR